MTDHNLPIEIYRVGNGFVIRPARCRYDEVTPVDTTMVFQTMKGLLAHIEQHFPKAEKPKKAKPA